MYQCIGCLVAFLVANVLSVAFPEPPKDSDKEPIIQIVSPKKMESFRPREEVAIKGKVAVPEGKVAFESITIMIVRGKSGKDRNTILSSFGLVPKERGGKYQFEATMDMPKKPGTYFIYAQGVEFRDEGSKEIKRQDSPLVEFQVAK